YAEVSPSGTGLKLLTRSPLIGSHVDHQIGIEVYTGGRYFALTGSLINGHDALPAEPQDLNWFIEEVFKKPAEVVGQHDDLIGVKLPLTGWPLEQVKNELLSLLSAEGYTDWLEVGMALHHQGDGAKEWLEEWDRWSKGGSTYQPGVCAQ